MNDDQNYWNKRAEVELARAKAASDPAISKPHYELAGLYLDRVHGELARRPRLSIVTR